ncbi:MAG: hypothetical protein KDB61_02415 [Planctomycetes bacterium]|nr:hypothetical protein [Planctomycetota bacterium]
MPDTVFFRGTGENTIKVMGTYEADHARKVIRASIEDYKEEFQSDDRRSPGGI